MAIVPEEGEDSLPHPGTPDAERYLWTMRGVCLELTHNYGTELDPGFKVIIACSIVMLIDIAVIVAHVNVKARLVIYCLYYFTGKQWECRAASWIRTYRSNDS